jgi:hypothetical protein
MRVRCLVGIGFALSGVLGCGSSSESPNGADASSAGDSSREDATGGDATAGDANEAVDALDDRPDGASVGDANDGGEAEASCARVPQADGGACPGEGGTSSGQTLLYACGLPSSIADLDGGAIDGGWAVDGGHTVACMILCNDISNCYVTPSTAPAVLVTCCP